MVQQWGLSFITGRLLLAPSDPSGSGLTGSLIILALAAGFSSLAFLALVWTIVDWNKGALAFWLTASLQPRGEAQADTLDLLRFPLSPRVDSRLRHLCHRPPSLRIH